MNKAEFLKKFHDKYLEILELCHLLPLCCNHQITYHISGMRALDEFHSTVKKIIKEHEENG